MRFKEYYLIESESDYSIAVSDYHKLAQKAISYLKHRLKNLEFHPKWHNPELEKSTKNSKVKSDAGKHRRDLNNLLKGIGEADKRVAKTKDDIRGLLQVNKEISFMVNNNTISKAF